MDGMGLGWVEFWQEPPEVMTLATHTTLLYGPLFLSIPSSTKQTVGKEGKRDEYANE